MSDDYSKDEVWTRVFCGGYFPDFREQTLMVLVCAHNPEYPEKSEFKGYTYIQAGLEADEEGKIDLTHLMCDIKSVQEKHPTYTVKAYTTGFMRKIKFNKKLLNTPIPESLLNILSGVLDHV